MPSSFPGKDFYVTKAEVVVGVSGVLHDRRFVDAGSRLSCRKMLCVTSCYVPYRLAHVVVLARGSVEAGTVGVVDDTVHFIFFKFVFRTHELFP